MPVTVHVPREWADNLQALLGDHLGDPQSLEELISWLLDHAQRGIYRPGARERDWLCQVVGDRWLDHCPTPREPGRG